MEDITTRIQKLEDKVLALELLLAQVIAYLPAPHALFHHLVRDSETEALYSKQPDAQTTPRIDALKGALGLALAMRLDMAQTDAKQIAQVLGRKD